MGALAGTPGKAVMAGQSPATLPGLARAHRGLAGPAGEALNATGSRSHPAGAESQGHGEGRAVRALREAESSPTCSPRARPRRLRASLPRCPPAPAESRPLSPHLVPRASGQTEGGQTPLRARTDTGLQTPFRHLRNAGRGISLFISFFFISF